jgi:hypothetical protein
MLLWFLTIGVLGVRAIIAAPAVLEAASPHCALVYVVHAPPARFRRGLMQDVAALRRLDVSIGVLPQ